jgi:hypothetical protein
VAEDEEVIMETVLEVGQKQGCCWWVVAEAEDLTLMVAVDSLMYVRSHDKVQQIKVLLTVARKTHRWA